MADKFFREPFNVPRRYTFSVAVTSLGTGSRTTKRGRNTIVAQWHASPDPFPGGEPNRSPPLALRIHNGKWAITFGSEPKFRSTEQYLANNWRYVGAVQENEWITWDFRLRWGYRGEGSYTEVWKNGELVFLLEEPNAFNDIRGVYLKLGLYHPPSDQRLLMDDIVIDGAGRLGD
ncbi:MAG: heparin lyase I family protein [Pseudomonadota bacterium]